MNDNSMLAVAAHDWKYCPKDLGGGGSSQLRFAAMLLRRVYFPTYATYLSIPFYFTRAGVLYS